MKRLLQIGLGILALLAAGRALAYGPQDCVRCHGDGPLKGAPPVSVEAFRASVHGEAITCQDCHEGVVDESHTRVKGSGRVDCTQCHDRENRHGTRSGREDRPACHACHTKHRILEPEDRNSSVHSRRLQTTCRGCHPAQCGDSGYLSWFASGRMKSHKKQDFAGSFGKDECLGCHQGGAAHGEGGPVNRQTCHQCHFDENGRPALLGTVHGKADWKKSPGAFAAAVMNQIFLCALLWGGIRFFMGKRSGKGRGPRR